MSAGGQQQRRLEELCLKSNRAHAELRERYQFDQHDWIEDEIRNAYKRGLHAEVSAQVLRYLEVKHKSQSEVADFLGVERSAVSKMKSSGSVKAAYLELAISIGFGLNREHANRNALIEAAFFVRCRVMQDSSCSSRMSEAEYTELICGELNEWYEAFILALMEVESWIGK